MEGAEDEHYDPDLAHAEPGQLDELEEIAAIMHDEKGEEARGRLRALLIYPTYRLAGRGTASHTEMGTVKLHKVCGHRWFLCDET